MLYTLASSQSWHHKLIFRSPPGSEAAAWSDGLFMMIFWFSAFFFVLLMGLMVYWTIKYRRRPGVPAPVSPHHNTPLEIIWTVVPSSALLVIFLYGFQGYLDKMVVPSQSLELKVTGSKWNWDAVYPSGVRSTEFQYLEMSEDGEFRGKEYPIIYVPENTDISLRMSSLDVIHAFWIPAFRSKIDVYPNRYTGFVFSTPSVGADDVVYDAKNKVDIPGIDMWVFCAEYCGDDHSKMAATIRVVSRETYERKLGEFADTGDPVENGRLLAKTLCATCHSVDGSVGTGPSWLDVFGSTGSVTIPADGVNESVLKDDNYIRESVYLPGVKVVPGYVPSMPSFQGQVSEEQLGWLIAYMKSVSQYAPEPALIDGEPADAPADAESTETEPSEVNDGGES